MGDITPAVNAMLSKGVDFVFKKEIENIVRESNPDVVVITGDTVEPQHVRHLSELLSRIFPKGLPLVVTLGNHEFWHHTFEQTLCLLKEQTVESKNIHYLDLIGGIKLGEMHFVGGTLFFDGSMRISENQNISDWDGWNDYYITDIETRYLEFNRYYTDMIRSRMKPGMATVLCTHHLPHEALNGHAPSHYSFYSGMKDFVHELPFDPKFSNYLICGHTHRRIIGEVIPGFMCVNIGSDYGILTHYLLDV